MNGGEPPEQVVSTSRRTILNVGKGVDLMNPIVIAPSTTTNVVFPDSVSGQPSWVQPMSNQPTWCYTDPGNQPTIVNQNYQPISLGNVFPRIPYPGNTNTP